MDGQDFPTCSSLVWQSGPLSVSSALDISLNDLNGIKAEDFQKAFYWLVVWNTFYFSTYWECHHPSWRTLIFFRGVGQPTTNHIHRLSIYYPLTIGVETNHHPDQVIAMATPVQVPASMMTVAIHFSFNKTLSEARFTASSDPQS